MNVIQMTIISTTVDKNPLEERVALIVNERVWSAILGCNLKNNMILVCFQGKPFTVIQVYVPTTDTKEAEADWFYEWLQGLLELTPKKDVLFIIGDWNTNIGSWKIPEVTGKFGLGVRNEAGQILTEFCQENNLVIANTLLQQPKRQLYTWTSPGGWYRKSDWLYSWQPKMEKFCTVSKNKTWSWVWLRSWTPYCKIQTYFEESRENH